MLRPRTLPWGVAVFLATTFAVLPVQAETIFLKDGTRVQGKILKQEGEVFQVQTAQGVARISKDQIAVDESPDPDIALALGIGFPGAGNAYTNRYDKTAFYAALTALSFGVSFGLVKFASSATAGLTMPILAGAGTALIPWGLGAYEAYLEAKRQDAQPKYKIQYSTDN